MPYKPPFLRDFPGNKKAAHAGGRLQTSGHFVSKPLCKGVWIVDVIIQADEYRQAASQYESAEKTVAQLKAEMLRFKGKRKLTQEMVDLFVAQVRIYENKNLEIVLNYEDELKKFAELNMEREAG